MNNAATLIQSRNARKAKARQNKPSATLPAVIKQPVRVTFNIAAPPGGFRTTSVRQNLIVDEIKKFPKLTAREYADRLLMHSTEVNDALLYSRDARYLAEQGMVSISSHGRVPRWAKLCANKRLISIRARQPQIVAANLPRSIKGANRAALNEAISMMQNIIISTTNRKMKTLLDQAVDSLIKSGKSFAALDGKAKLLISAV